MKHLLLTAGLVILAQPALAQTVIESDFIVTITEADGTETSESTLTVPLRNGACYNWWLRLAKAKSDITITEEFTLPSPPSSWGEVNDSTTISDDQLTASSVMTLTPSDGWIGHGWCAAKGDPAGDHLIVVKSGEETLGTFAFVVEE